MIVITVELKSAISHTRDKVLGVMTIANDGTGTATSGNYTATLRGAGRRVIESCIIKSFPRKRMVAWDLVYRALRVMRGDRHGDDVTNDQRRVLACGQLSQQNNDAVVSALRDVVEDLEARWDMRDPRTNPGIRENVTRARAALDNVARRDAGGG